MLKSRGFESSSKFCCSLAEADVAGHAWILDFFNLDREGGTLYHLDNKIGEEVRDSKLGTYRGDLCTGSFFQSFSGP